MCHTRVPRTQRRLNNGGETRARRFAQLEEFLATNDQGSNMGSEPGQVTVQRSACYRAFRDRVIVNVFYSR